MITKLIIKNNSALSKKGSTFVELTIKDILNIILGRNGFGKTSLLRELTVYPPDNADYLPGGYKEVHCVDGKNTFKLTSSTGKSSEHHFIMNGKELNEGNTLLVQRELVKIHFGVTNNIKAVITGLDVRDLFTTLSAPRRKDFLMGVNPNDTSYALKVFDRLRGNLNAIKGGLKTQRQRLVVEEGRMASLAGLDPEKLKEEISKMDSQIKNALIIHGQLSMVDDPDLQTYKQQIGNIISFLMSTNSIVKHPKRTLLSMKEKSEGTLDYYKNREVKLTSILHEVSTQLSGVDLNNTNLDGYKAILEQNANAIKLNEEEVVYLTERFKDHDIFTDLVEDKEFANLSEELIHYLQSVTRTRDENINSQLFVNKRDQIEVVGNEIAGIKHKLNDITHQLNHFKNADSVSCPKCENQFKPGFEQVDPVKLQSQFEVLRDRGVELNKQLTELKDYVEANQGWYESMESLVRYARRTNFVTPILKMISEYKVGKSDISVLINLIRSTSQLAGVRNTLETLNTEKDQVSAQVKFLESTNVEQLFQRAEYIERELAVSQSGVSRTLSVIRDIDNQLATILEDEQKRDRLGILIREMEDAMMEAGKYRIKLRIEDVINDLSPRKEQLISNLIRAESLNSVIESIKDNIADLERREKHTILLVDGLSPVKGLIGYLMNDFLRSVIANVNAIIQPIWTNRLHVLNCSQSKSEEDVDLTYAFPVLTGSNDKPNKDIGDCSGGEREIINFAFRIVLRRYLGERCQVPLMMDEVGVAFDELHRGRFWGYIAEQLRLGKLPQTFMITHNYKEFANNPDANFIALNTEGLNIPVAVNKNSNIR